MFTFVYTLCVLVVNGCNYYQEPTNLAIFEADACTMSYEDNNHVMYSMGYYCTLFGSRIQLRHWSNTADCKGTDYNILGSYSCPDDTCNCHDDDDIECPSSNIIQYNPSECDLSNKLGYLYYNATILMDFCVNHTLTTCGDNRQENDLYFQKYSDKKCNGKITSSSVAMNNSCFDPNCSSSSNNDDGKIFEISFSSIIVIGIVLVMSLGTICTICCMIKKYRKKQKNQINDVDADNLIINGKKSKKRRKKNKKIKDKNLLKEGIVEQFGDDNYVQIEQYKHVDDNIAKPHDHNDADGDIVPFDDHHEGIEGDDDVDGI